MEQKEICPLCGRKIYSFQTTESTVLHKGCLEEQEQERQQAEQERQQALFLIIKRTDEGLVVDPPFYHYFDQSGTTYLVEARYIRLVK